MAPTVDKIFEVATEFYDELVKHSEIEKIGKRELCVYRGSMTQIWDDITSSQSYYVPVMDFLRDHGYMTVVQRGTRGRESVLVFHGRPEREHLDDLPLTGLSEPARLRLEFETLRRQLGGIDIAEAFKNVEGRLTQIENTLYSKGKEVNGKTKKRTSRANTRDKENI
jgi:hypothetical protein